MLDILTAAATTLLTLVVLVAREVLAQAVLPEPPDRTLLRYGDAAKFLAASGFALGLGLLLGLLAGCVAGDPPRPAPWGLALAAIMPAAGLLLLREVRRQWWCDATGIGPAVAGNPPWLVRWSEVREVRYRSFVDQIVLRDAAGRVVRVGGAMHGVAALWACLEAQVPAACWEMARRRWRWSHGGRTGTP